MKLLSSLLSAVVPAVLLATMLSGQDLGPSAALDQARAAQAAGDWAKAKSTLSQAAKQNPNDLPLAQATARLLDASGDPGRRDAYAHLVTLLKEKGQDDSAARHRLALLDLAAGDRKGAAATGALKLPELSKSAPAGTIHIPGPLSGFRRLTAISSQTTTDGLMSALARNVFTLGYHFSQRQNKTAPTEYMTLVINYLEEARELEKMGGPDGQLRVASCADGDPLLKVIGYKLRKGGCGPSVVLETNDAQRAFLTIDSGFPLAQLENAFRTGQPFAMNVRGTDVPILFGTDAWFEKGGKADPLDQFLDSRDLPRLYYAMSRLDSTTAETLRKSPGLNALRDVAPVIDFYGNSFAVVNGKLTLPGGPQHFDDWVRMIGFDSAQAASKPGELLSALISKDNGWLAAYADSFQQMDARTQNYYFTGGRLERFYKALRGSDVNPGSARPVFRPNAELLTLPSRLRLGSDGVPLIPGGVGAWKTLFQQATPKGAKGGTRTATPTPRLNDADDVIEAMYARVRLFEENGLLGIFLALNEADRRRSRPLETSTVLALAHDYAQFSHHYAIFSDWPELSDAAIVKFLKTCDSLVKIKTPLVKADALGTFQALVGLWEILGRQGQIPAASLGSSFDALLTRFSFAEKEKPGAVFDAGRAGLEGLIAATGTTLPAPRQGGQGIQEAVVNLLAIPSTVQAGDPAIRQSREYMLSQFYAAYDSQRLIRLDTLFGLADSIERPGQAGRDALLKMAGQLREFRLPTPYVSAIERNAAFPGYWTERHMDQMRDVDLGQLVEKKNRGLLAPFLRDTLVGLNYAYYSPPGAQVMFHNPMFVRSHDFLGRNGSGTGNEVWGPAKISGTGWPLSGGGRLVGALSGLPYGLAEAEQDFLVPDNTQALIWNDLAPQMLVSAVVPRWWQVTPRQQRWVALNQRFAEDLAAEAVCDAAVRGKIISLLRSRVEPSRLEQVSQALEEARLDDALRLTTPAEMYRLAREYGAPSTAIDSPAWAELAQLASSASQEVSDASISKFFGVPRPKLARSWRPELLGLAPLPAMQGYSSRLMAESWESNNLYWARVADETNLTPAALNWLVPQLTRRLIENIFANHHEDWPALLRAMHRTAEEYRQNAGPAGAAPALN